MANKNFVVQNGLTVGPLTIDAASGNLDGVNNITISGNITPTEGNVYSLGSAAFPWKDLYVSSNTIYIGSTTLSVNESGQLEVGGNAAAAVDSVNSMTGNVVITAANIGAQETLVSGTNIKTINGASLLGAGDVEISSGAGGTVTYVGAIVPTGLEISGSPITASGNLVITYATGYSIPTTSKQGNWDTAYGWGNHASAGYALSSNLAAVATSGSYNDLSNLPDLSALADIEQYADLSSFPVTGESNKVYIAQDTGYMYRWNGSGYTQLTDQTAIWGQISGNISLQTDLQSALSAKQDVLTSSSTVETGNLIVAEHLESNGYLYTNGNVILSSSIPTTSVGSGAFSIINGGGMTITNGNLYMGSGRIDTNGLIRTSGDLELYGSGKATLRQLSYPGGTSKIVVTDGFNITASNASTGIGTGALTVGGGATVAGNLYVGEDITLVGNLSSINSPYADFDSIIGRDLYIDGNASVQSQVSVYGSVGGNVLDSISPDTGAIVVRDGGIGIASGNLHVGNNVVLNSYGWGNSSVLLGGYYGLSAPTLAAYAGSFDATTSTNYDSVVLGSNVVTYGSKLSVVSTDSIIVPVGNTSQRPSGEGYTDVFGMLRYNTDSNGIEWFNGTSWYQPATEISLKQDTLVSNVNIKTINGTSVLGSGDIDIPVESVNGLTGNVVLDTDDISEGSANLYFSNTRAVTAIQNDASWNATDWDTAYGWGNHASAGYALSSSLATVATSGSYNDLTNKPNIPQGTVESVGVSVPTGLSVTGSPVTTSGNIAISYTAGYSIPTTSKQGNWDTAYGWGDHASAGYQANLVSGTNIKTLNGTSLLGSGDIVISGGATLTNDTTTNASYYLGMSASNSGSWGTAYVSDSKLYFNPSTGVLHATEFQSLSDARQKDNVEIITDALGVINKLRGVNFNWKENGKASSGVIAQEVEEVLPFLVDTNEEGIKSVNYDAIIGYLIEAVKSLTKGN